MIHTSHEIPNFKNRLTEMREELGEEIPGFGPINRTGLASEKLT